MVNSTSLILNISHLTDPSLTSNLMLCGMKTTSVVLYTLNMSSLAQNNRI